MGTDDASKKGYKHNKERGGSARSQERGRRGGPNIAFIKAQMEEKERMRKEEEENLAKEKLEEERKRKEELERKAKQAEQAELVKKEKKKQRMNKEEEQMRNRLRRFAISGIRKKEKKDITVSEKDRDDYEFGNDNAAVGTLKSPICCILGHVDTGKTKILDAIRHTDVQGSEAGGITQQIGATYFPMLSICRRFGVNGPFPGILVVDTPGHESFSNLRIRGSTLCNLAILVVDIFHLIEPQTKESIELLKITKTPFVVALNKIDRIFDWNPNNSSVKGSSGFSDVLSNQKRSVKREFSAMIDKAVMVFAEAGLNARLFNENPDYRKFVSLVPTSAVTGQGLDNLIAMIIKMSYSYMKKTNTISDEFQCVVMEIRPEEGFGITADVILINGSISDGETVCMCGSDGPIITKVRGILIPESLKDTKAKTKFRPIKTARASLGIKIVAQELEKVIPGTKVVKVGEDIEQAKVEVESEIAGFKKRINIREKGVHVQSSTLGSLEALCSFLSEAKIPVASVGIGSLKKMDIMKVSSQGKYAAALCFDSEADKEALEFAKESGVKVITSKIIYHLLDQYSEYVQSMVEEEKEKFGKDAVYPCMLSIVPKCIFTTRSPLVLGVEVKEGKLRIETPIFVERNGKIERLGKVVSIERNKSPLKTASKGEKVAIKIESDPHNGIKMYERHFNSESLLYSLISRKSIDVTKRYFRDELTDEDCRLIVKLKAMLGII